MSRAVDLDAAVAALGEGGVVALPTDTVYGVAASIRFPEAVASLFALKRRPSSLALPVLVASPAALHDLVTDWPDVADRLARALWPGALTLVVGATPALCALVHAPRGRVGFRVPDDPGLVALLTRSGPLALTSANAHGEAPCTSADEVRAAFAPRDELAGVLDGGRRDGQVSTVVEVTDEGWQVLREGAISTARIDCVALGEAGSTPAP